MHNKTYNTKEYLKNPNKDTGIFPKRNMVNYPFYVSTYEQHMQTKKKIIKKLVHDGKPISGCSKNSLSNLEL